MKKGGIVII